MTRPSVGVLLRDARAAHGLSLQQVAKRARCSAGYVYKLEMDHVRTPSPRVLAGLAEALGLPYGELMGAVGYDHPPPPPDAPSRPSLPGAVERYSNAHIVELLEQLQREVLEVRALLTALAAIPAEGRAAQR